MKKLDLADPATRSADLVAENIAALRMLFPEVINEGADGAAINVDVLKALVGDATVTDPAERYGLSWFGKRRARQLALTPSTGTLRPCPEDSVDWETTGNLMIEGDNLEVLKLLQKSYAEKVKFIYIDPPYNTGSDLIYRDDYVDTIGNYLSVTGQVDRIGSAISTNTEANGRFHTIWLSMMYPRLKLARNILRQDGVLAISIGERELGNLLSISNEIYGEENLITICSRVMKTGGQKGVHFSPCVDYIAIYAKNIEDLGPFRSEISQNVIDKVYTRVEESGPRKGQKYRTMGLYQAMLERRANQRFYIRCPDGQLVIPPGDTFPSNDEDGAQVAPGDGDGVWRWTYSRFRAELQAGNVEFVASDRTSLVTTGGGPARWNVYYKIWLNDRLEQGQLPGNILEKFESRHSSAELKALNIPFDFAKPSALIKFLMTVCGVKATDITLDFFAGSASTGHAALELSAESGESYPFICVQIPETTKPDSEEARAGFHTIADIAKERLRRVATKIRQENPLFGGDLGFRVFKLDSTNIRAWDPDRNNIARSLEDSVEHLKADRAEQDILYELLLKLGLDLCVPVETRTIAGAAVHSIGRGTLIACLASEITAGNVEALGQGIVSWRKELSTAGETTCVFRDSAFADDVAKTNLAAILEQSGIATVRSL